jgi:hypothetical protein
MGEQPTSLVLPQLVVGGEPLPHLARDLVSMVVHDVAGRATAEVELSGSPEDPPRGGDDLGATLAVRLWAAGDVFAGSIVEIELRHDAAGAPSTILRAAGQPPDDVRASPLSLRFGHEIQTGSVRRRADGSTAHCVVGAERLSLATPVTLVTQTPDFDGPFEIVELWHRFDLTDGLRVEFVAVG